MELKEIVEVPVEIREIVEVPVEMELEYGEIAAMREKIV